MPADLLRSPRCHADQLGQPMPDSNHAVSACLPLWAHNIGYEEGDASVIDQLQAAYPRFCLHPQVRRLFGSIFGESSGTGYIFPSQRSAQRALDYLTWRGGSSGTMVPIADQPSFGIRVEAAELPLLREYWQHAGEVLSSRSAELILGGATVRCSETESRKIVRQRVAELQQADSRDVWLFPSGMAAIASAWRAVRAHNGNDPSVQFGFPYVDTLKIQQRFQPADYRFYPLGSAADLDALELALQQTRISAVFCEAPANPLLTCPDLHRLRHLADQHQFLVIVDDTLAACLNLNVLALADMVVTSLTKYFSGYGDVLAGSLTLNSAGANYQRLRSFLELEFEELLTDIDVEVLEHNSRDLRQRIDVINTNAAQIADRLHQHPAVQQVWHPSIELSGNFENLRRPAGGYGGLLSIVLREPSVSTPLFFDALQVCKGPNLGTYFTLCCPYTILAHYNELEFAESCGVSRWLLRISVGTEPLDELWSRFAEALKAVSTAVAN